jgi:hypothetical protein
MELAQITGRKQRWRRSAKTAYPLASTIGWRATRAQLGWCTATGRGLATTQRAEATDEKSHGGAEHLRDVKNEGTSGDVYENKGQATI